MLPDPHHELAILTLALLVGTAVGCTPSQAKRERGANDVNEPRSTLAEPPTLASVAVGQRAPKFQLRELSTGEPIGLTPGKVHLLFFWATWSYPDKRQMPKLQELYLRYRARGLEVVAISVDDEPSSVLEAARSWGATFPVVWDREHMVAGAYRPASEPSTYVVDAAGVVRFLLSGYHDGAEDDLEREVSALLSGSAARSKP